MAQVEPIEAGCPVIGGDDEGGGAAGAPALLTLDLEVGVGRVEARTAATPPPGGSI